MGIAKKAAKSLKGKADERYMNGTPTRLEVANYVNALMEEKYMPMFQSMVQMSAMVIQGILIEKSICTGEELEEITKQFMEEQEKRMAATKTINSTALLKEVLTQDYIDNLKTHLEDIKSNKIGFEDKKVVNDLYKVYEVMVSTMQGLLDKTEELTDASREEILKRLVEFKRQVESGEVQVKNSTERSRVLGILWDAIIPFAHKHLGTFAKYGDSADYRGFDILDKLDELVELLEEQDIPSDVPILKKTEELLKKLLKPTLDGVDSTITDEEAAGVKSVRDSVLSIQNDWLNGSMKDNPNRHMVINTLVRVLTILNKYIPSWESEDGESSVASDSVPSGNA